MRSILVLATTLLLAYPVFARRIEVTIPTTKRLTGHLILVITKKAGNGEPEPRMQLQETYTSAQGFGVDVTDLAPNKPIVIDDKTIGYPRKSLADLDPGDYTVQAVFNVYEQFHLASGKTLWLPPDQGEGQHWNLKPGNPYNAPVRLHLDPKSNATLKLTLDKVIPPIAGTERDPEVIAAKEPGAKWLKYIRFRSEKLSKFWGRDMYLGAWVLLPDGFDQHPDARYPLVVYQDHFRPGFGAPLPWVTTPPASADNSRAVAAYKFFQDWTAGRLPRVLLLYVQSPNPYYDDSYDVDSANVGPYGAAINEELIPAIEQKYRGIGQGWARATYGGSTGGWESLATQIFYPDLYNGTYTACPDPIDFHAYQNVDLYDDTNAFVRKGDFGEIPIAADRKPDGSIIGNTGDEYRYEYVLGTHGRSTEQWDIWQAVFSPAGSDGYPEDVIDPLTGAIDKSTVAYWHDRYDLTAILQRDWRTLGPKLEGKLHLSVGDGDTYFLNNAVHLLQSTLDDTRNPHSDATFQYGPGMPHCYIGGPVEYTMEQNHNNWAQRVLPQMVEHMLRTAPPGADTKSWRY
ncbi:alpha/beta hydrolase-fold protein [Edaphobacter paludis]|uniref:Alpha/beta hydrolase-fold protein n=1 Tax=Edaphobacter paludis TaxID=3035702 RepID=A0AAU7CVZ3_9BACT